MSISLWSVSKRRKYLYEEATPEQLKPLIGYLSLMYDSEIAYIDWWIGVLYRQLQEMELLENTLIILTADHGENFFEHGELGHGVIVYNENLRIPLVISHPGLFPEQKRRPEPVGLIDVFPTLATLIGRDPPAQAQGFDVLREDRPREVYIERFFPGGAGLLKLQNEKWSLIYHTLTKKTQLFDLASDPAERHNVLSFNLPIVKEMRSRLLGRYADNLKSPYRVEKQTKKVDEAIIENLEALGYVN